MSRAFELPRMDRVVSGIGAVDQLQQQVQAVGISKPMVVASRTLATTTDVVARIADMTGAVGVHHGIPAHVPRESVLEVVQQCRELGADGLVSVGGGSPVDCAKAVALCLGEGVEDGAGLATYRIRYRHPGPAEVPTLRGRPPAHVAVGTTLSGGEFTSIVGVTDAARGVKDLFRADALTPRVAILDPALAAHTPRWLWLSTGMRAIDHIVEGVYSPRRTPLTDAVLIEALRILARDLLSSGGEPQDLHRRGRCQVAAWMAIMHLGNVSTGLSHGLGHQLGAMFGVPHGVTSCILLPPVMEFNRPVTADRQALVAQALGVDVTGMSDDEAATAGVAELRSMLSAMGVPTRLREVGVAPEHFDGLVEEALQDMVVAGNPRTVTARDVRAVLEAAY